MNYQITLDGNDVAMATEVGTRRNQSNIYWGQKTRKSANAQTSISTSVDLPGR